MPKYVLPIPRVFETVTRPLIKKLTEEVCTQFNIPPKTEFVFYGRAEGIAVRNSTLGDRDNGLRLNTETRLHVTYEEEAVNPLEVTVFKTNQRFVFVDPSLHVWIKPVLVSTKLTVNFEYIAKDKNSASEWRQQAQLNSYRMVNQFNFDADFHYYIPNPVSLQLTRIHALREKSVVPLNESLGQWFNRCYVKNVRVLTDVAGKRATQAIAVKLVGLQALIDMKYDIAPIERDNPAGNWRTSFSVSLYYDRPDDVVFFYPLMIHNQLIPKKYREDNPVSLYQRTGFTGNASQQIKDLSNFEMRNNQFGIDRFNSGIKLPRFDDWMHTHQLKHHTCVSTLLIALMPDDARWLFTFDNEYLGDYGLHPKMEKYLKTCGKSLLIPYDSLFYLSLHSWDDLVDNKLLTIDENLKLSSTVDLDYKNMYHVVMTMLTDLTKLSDKGKEDLEKNPDIKEEVDKEEDKGEKPFNPLINVFSIRTKRRG